MFTFWAILWVVYRGVSFFREGGTNYAGLLVDILLPLASLALLFTSRYMDAARRTE